MRNVRSFAVPSSNMIHARFVLVGLAVSHLGNSSIRYRLGLFKFLEECDDLPLDLVRGYFSPQFEQQGLLSRVDPKACAIGTFVHVVVDKSTQTPTSIPAQWREHLGQIVVSP